MTEKDKAQEIDWNEAGYDIFLKRQADLRSNLQATTPLMDAANYPEIMERRNLLRSNGFDANEHSSGGLSIFIETEEDYKKLQDLAKSKGLKINMAKVQLYR